MKQVESGKTGAHHDYIEFTNRLMGISSGGQLGHAALLYSEAPRCACPACPLPRAGFYADALTATVPNSYLANLG